MFVYVRYRERVCYFGMRSSIINLMQLVISSVTGHFYVYNTNNLKFEFLQYISFFFLVVVANISQTCIYSLR